MNARRVISVSAIADQIASFAPKQVVFVVMSGRGKAAGPLFVSISKHAADTKAGAFRAGREPATFKTACVKQGFVSAPAEITLF